MTKVKTMLDWALGYHAKGFNVIPISVSNKTPLVKFKDKKFTRDEVIQMWTKYPKANIAVTTDKIFVVDIDVHEGQKSGFESIETWPNKDLLIPTLTQRTASGGQQMVYFKRLDIEVRQRIGWLESVDIKASPNNYFLVPPSRTAKGQYEWINKLDIVTPSRELILEIMKNKSSNHSDYNGNYPLPGSKTYGAQMWELFSTGATDGARNDSTNKLLHYWRKIGIEPSVCMDLLENFNTRSNPPLEEQELMTIWGSVWQ